MPKKILMITGDFAEDYETMVPFQTLAAVGHTVHAVCPARRRARPSPRPSTISRATRPTRKNAAIILRSTLPSRDVKPADYDALSFRARAPEYLRLNADVLAAVRYFFEATACCGRLPRRAIAGSGRRPEGPHLFRLSGLPP